MDYRKVVVELDGKRYALVPVDLPESRTVLDLVDIPSMARGALRNAGIDHLEQVLAMSESEVLRLPGVGRKALNALRDALSERGWRIGQFRHEV